MRRPAPLPASPDDPDAGVSAEVPQRRRRRLIDDRAAAVDAAVDVAVDHDSSGPDAGDRRSGPLTTEDGGPGPDPGSLQVRSSEVWRAARARRRALRAEIRRFTQRSRRRRLVWWGSLGAVVALVLGSVIAAYSPLFAVERITIAGARTLEPAVLQHALSGQLGAPLALVDASAVKSVLTEFPLIESYALEARPPHELLVRIVERTPIGVIRSDAGHSLVDAAGVVLATTPDAPAGQPQLDVAGGIGSAAFRSAGLVIRSLPADVRASVVEVHASSGDDVTLKLQDGKSVVWGSEQDSVKKSVVLVRLMQASPDSRTFDVSSPMVPVVR